MPIFSYKDEEALGSVRSVDTSTVIVAVQNIELLRQLQVNRLVALESSRAGQHLIGIVQKITRVRNEAEEAVESDGAEVADAPPEENLVRITLIGTFLDKSGKETDVFRRTLETVPEIDANCFPIEKDHLTKFMQSVSQAPGEAAGRLVLGHYTLDEKAEAVLNGNKFFQRHALVVGSTGSGKSWTTANIIEQAARLANTNAVVFDIHGEYGPLEDDGVAHFRVAGTGDLDKKATLADGVIYLPYWLLTYEDMVSIFVDRSDQNAPNQAMTLSRAVTAAKKKFLEANMQKEVLANFTVDSPVPYSLDAVIEELKSLNTEMVAGARGEKQGEFYGRLSRFIARLENKRADRRLGFMFAGGKEADDWNWLPRLAKSLMAGRRDQDKKKGGIKILDFSEVPSDVLPLVIGLVARLIFSVQQWSKVENRHPIALFCDEAHLYLPSRADSDTAASAALGTFERIAKEGRKYGVGLIVISQRPSEVSRTVLSQCNNVLSMRLTNGEDQEVVKRLLPDSLGGFSDLLPILDKGEAIIVGDASILPSRIRISEPKMRPNSATIDFWDRWSEDKKVEDVAAAVQALRRQSQG